MTTDQKKTIIAHELGHAVMGGRIDFGWIASEIKLKTDRGDAARAYCNMDETGRVGNNSVKGTTQLINICDLGGMFGELVYGGEWSPWGASYDLEEFVLQNIKSKSKLINEIFWWLWNAKDDLAYLEMIRRKPTINGKRTTIMNWYETMNRLPELWKVYLDFCGRIDINEYKVVVNEIRKSGTEIVSGEELRQYINRVVRS